MGGCSFQVGSHHKGSIFISNYIRIKLIFFIGEENNQEVKKKRNVITKNYKNKALKDDNMPSERGGASKKGVLGTNL